MSWFSDFIDDAVDFVQGGGLLSPSAGARAVAAEQDIGPQFLQDAGRFYNDIMNPAGRWARIAEAYNNGDISEAEYWDNMVDVPGWGGKTSGALDKAFRLNGDIIYNYTPEVSPYMSTIGTTIGGIVGSYIPVIGTAAGAAAGNMIGNKMGGGNRNKDYLGDAISAGTTYAVGTIGSELSNLNSFGNSMALAGGGNVPSSALTGLSANAYSYGDAAMDLGRGALKIAPGLLASAFTPDMLTYTPQEAVQMNTNYGSSLDTSIPQANISKAIPVTQQNGMDWNKAVNPLTAPKVESDLGTVKYTQADTEAEKKRKEEELKYYLSDPRLYLKDWNYLA